MIYELVCRPIIVVGRELARQAASELAQCVYDELLETPPMRDAQAQIRKACQADPAVLDFDFSGLYPELPGSP